MMLRVAFACLLAALSLGAKVTMPRFKWGQNKELIFLSVMVRDLEKSSVAVSLPDEGTLSFKSKNTQGVAYELDLPLREDVKKESMKYELLARSDKWGDVVFVTLAKQNQHPWDLLVSDVKKFKDKMDKDWAREDPTMEAEDEIPYFEDNSDYLTELTSKNLEKVIKKSNTVIANVRYPWCTQCKTQDETFAKAAKEAKRRSKKEAKWKKVTFAVVDAREQRQLGRELGATCGFDCEYKVYTELGEAPVGVKSKWSESELLAEVEKFTLPAVQILKSDGELAQLREKNTTALGTFSSEQSSEFKLYKRVAALMRGDMVFAASFGKDAAVELWPHKQNFSFKYDGDFGDNGTALHRWTKPRAIPLLQSYDWQLRETYEKLGLPLAKLWIDDKDANPSFEKVLRHVVRRVAKKFIGRIAFVELTKSMYSYELRDFGLNHPEEYPAFGIASNGSYGAIKYGFEVGADVATGVQEFWRDADKAVEKVTDFCEQVLAGTWPVAHESGAVQKDWVAGQVKQLVWKSYAEIQKAEKPLLLEVHSKFRSDKERKVKESEHLATSLKDFSEKFTVASYDTAENYLPGEDFPREKYSSDTEWYWVPRRVEEKAEIKKLTKPKKDAPIETVIEFALKHAELADKVEEVKQQFQKLMVDDPPPTTTTPPPMPDMGDDMDGMGGMGGMPGMGGMGGMPGMGGGGMGDMPGMGDMSEMLKGLKDEM